MLLNTEKNENILTKETYNQVRIKPTGIREIFDSQQLICCNWVLIENTPPQAGADLFTLH